MRYGSFRLWVWDPAVVKAGLATPISQPVKPVEPSSQAGPARSRNSTIWIPISPHSLRATHLSLVAAQQGVLEAARRAGHSNSTVTVAHYARPLAGGDDIVAAWLDSIHRAQVEW